MASFNSIVEELKKDVEARKECQWHLNCFCEQDFKDGVQYAIDFMFDALKES